MQTFLVIFSLFPWLLQALADSCLSSYSQHNMKLVGHVLETYSAVRTSHQCSDKCALHGVCHSINYYSMEGICEVNNANHLTNPESLVYSAGWQYLNYFLQAVSRCSNQLCSYPLECNVDKNGLDYRCSSCKEQYKVLFIPNQTSTTKALYEDPFESLTAFTLSMWVQTDAASGSRTPFGYATPSEDNEIMLWIKSSEIQFYFNGDETLTGTVIDTRWHHICLTWTNVDGSYTVYVDGISKAQGTMKQGHVIQKGAVVLGQDQDSYKGGFQAYQSLQGNLTAVNMWDKVLTANEVSTLVNKCSTMEGNVIKWTDFHDKISGNAKLICCRFCDDQLP